VRLVQLVHTVMQQVKLHVWTATQVTIPQQGAPCVLHALLEPTIMKLQVLNVHHVEKAHLQLRKDPLNARTVSQDTMLRVPVLTCVPLALPVPTQIQKLQRPALTALLVHIPRLQQLNAPTARWVLLLRMMHPSCVQTVILVSMLMLRVPLNASGVLPVATLPTPDLKSVHPVLQGPTLTRQRVLNVYHVVMVL